MKKRSKIAVGAGAALAVVGAGGAVAADRLTPKAESQAIVNDAAKQLGVDPAKLSDALEQALRNRIDEAVKDGRLSKEQGDAMKRRITSAAFPLFIGPGFDRDGARHRAFGGPWGRNLDAAATYLGLTEAQLDEALDGGKSLAHLAKEKGKPADKLVDALVAATTKRLDQAVADGRMTKAQRDLVVADLKQRTTAIVNGTAPADGFRSRGHHGHGFSPGGPRDDG
jgi:polyhydroxyalkanoate synthesis regulator phasin